MRNARVEINQAGVSELDDLLEINQNEIAHVIADRYARKVGRDTGELERDIQTARQGDSVVIFSPTPWAGYHEFGTMPHRIEAKNGQALRFMGRDGEFVFRRGVNHPGTKANPAFREAIATPVTPGDLP